MKRCYTCRRRKRISEFYRYSASPDGRQGACKRCSRAAGKKYYLSARNRKKVSDAGKVYRQKNPEKCAHRSESYRKSHRPKLADYLRKYVYGLSPGDYRRLLISQRGKCQICRSRMLKPCVDHDHDTGIVRGLLCPKCNTGIGLLQDSSAIVLAACEYLKKHGK